MNRKIVALIVFLLTILPYSAHAILSMELTRGVAGAIPIAIEPFGANAPKNISAVISNDLQNSGRFKVSQGNADNIVTGKVEATGGDHYKVSFQLKDGLKGKGAESVVLSKEYNVPAKELRRLAHHISDLVYEQLTGIRGIFSTRIAYVVVQRSQGQPATYMLEVADQDGENPQTLLISPEPIMSPSWSPNGRQLAYVSFENKRSSIYLQDVASGSRRQLSHFPGINGAPAWSPDGSKMAIVLSKSGSPNIYVMDIATHSLKQMTNDFYINTEPSWSPDGRSLIFTSNRSGGPQIYQINLGSKAISRLSYDGDYNARASFTRDGSQIAMIHRVGGVYKIGLLDLDTGNTRVLTASTGDSASPSIAPNNSMILYDTLSGGRTTLGMVSSDGRIQLILPARNGDAQDPAWSPFMS